MRLPLTGAAIDASAVFKPDLVFSAVAMHAAVLRVTSSISLRQMCMHKARSFEHIAASSCCITHSSGGRTCLAFEQRALRPLGVQDGGRFAGDRRLQLQQVPQRVLLLWPTPWSDPVMPTTHLFDRCSQHGRAWNPSCCGKAARRSQVGVVASRQHRTGNAWTR